jgi:redox-sensitive bicupin YhaK (pirin superfamily)
MTALVGRLQQSLLKMDETTSAIELIIPPRIRDLGGFEVLRILPFRERRMVGPFIFLDQFGPLELIHGRPLEVAPHPHIGLATVTYLLSGMMMHRDSLGSVQLIRPGEVNWMTAGRGIVHSERTSAVQDQDGGMLFGVQTWVALPTADEEIDPTFAHHGPEELPEMEGEGIWARVILGNVFARRSPVRTLGDPVYADCHLDPGAKLRAPAREMEECGVCVISGSLLIEEQPFSPGTMVVFKPGAEPLMSSDVSTRILLLGGARITDPRYIWWNFVSSSKDRIEAAKNDWRERRFAGVPGDDGYIPLPE